MRKPIHPQILALIAVAALLYLYSFTMNAYEFYKPSINRELLEIKEDNYYNEKSGTTSVVGHHDKTSFLPKVQQSTSKIDLNGSGINHNGLDAVRNQINYGKDFEVAVATTNGTASDMKTKSNSSPRWDFKRRHWHTWPTHPTCRKYVVRFTSFNSQPQCALASYPGSGNTWFRYLIEAASGAFTSSLYGDGQLYMWGYLGEIEPVTDGTTLLQKTHEASPTTVQDNNSTAVLLIRNPYRAILSYHNFLFGGHTSYASMLNYRRKEWASFVHLQLRTWLSMIMIWAKEGRRVLVVHYENLCENPLGEIKRALDFLNLSPNEGRLSCLQENLGKTLKRNKEVFPFNLQIFSNKTRDKMDRGIRYASYLLEKKGHQALPVDRYEFYNGTSSNKIEFLPCHQNETDMECDDRVDRLNIESRLLNWHSIVPSYSSNSSLTKEVLTNTKLTPKNPKQKVKLPFDFHKSKLHKLETSAAIFVNKLLEIVTENPVKKMLEAPIDQALNLPEL